MTRHTWFLDEVRNAGKVVCVCGVGEGSEPYKQIAGMKVFLFCFFSSNAERFTSTHETLIAGQSAPLSSTSEHLQTISKSKRTSITQHFNTTGHGFRRRAKLETQVWLSALVGLYQNL